MKSLLAVLERPDGRWDRVWHRNDPDRESDGWTLGEPDGKPVVVPTDSNTRGLSWAMMGLLASHRLLPSEGYLNKARRMAEHLMRAQRRDGSWTFQYDKPEAEVGISEKGTAIWSLLFYRLFAETRDPRHLKAARKALAWCTARRETGPDPNALGGIIGITAASGVVYRRWYPLICTYTMSFYGNALLAELGQD
ncbi:MAG: hypothetical protein GY953_36525 [bacterium]|nr:hypothetical protein [bacterium]